MNILLGLAPFILFFLLARVVGAAVGLWAGAAVAIALLVRSRLRSGELKVLEIGAAALFVALAAVASFVRPDWSVFEIRVAVDLGLIAIAGGSLLIGRPFTLQYAREQVPPEQQRHPMFYVVNRNITAVWTLAFAIEAAASGCLAWLPRIPPLHSRGGRRGRPDRRRLFHFGVSKAGSSAVRRTGRLIDFTRTAAGFTQSSSRHRTGPG